MAFNFTKFNTKKYDWDWSEFAEDSRSLETLFEEDGEGTIYRVRGLIITDWQEKLKNKVVNHQIPTAVLDEYKATLPQHQLQQVIDMDNDPEAVEAINRGECGFKIRKYYKAEYDKWCYAADWLNLEADR